MDALNVKALINVQHVNNLVCFLLEIVADQNVGMVFKFEENNVMMVTPCQMMGVLLNA